MRQGMKVSLALLAFLGNLTWCYSAKANFKGNLTVEIDGFKNKQGQVCASIFAKSQGFPNNRDRVIQSQCTKITDTSVKLTFENLPAGSYAVAVMHDKNEDSKLNRNSLGIPTEGFGFSKNPEIRTSAPKFSEAAILLAGPNTNIQVHLKYL
ncbi:DUF2141 domain-containing protein [Calothrix sp. FACHB-1219]|uniref:DUF2141 domain-containing protein n=1 Tax=unclassified Calothrix TaxID=2619626 RepID=UPI00168260DE|nr:MULTISPECIES: DUF2141 domain-containing protein [unclassified Calothrix]MBD2203320.1 DUF2141 domain-containing protein [Calothrix sp. FACHB-168]MBD2216383.1 DUF2141 domain-containing protein [Calothrix sp. FACHB-1219]